MWKTYGTESVQRTVDFILSTFILFQGFYVTYTPISSQLTF